jgi:hypothetical protein
VTFVLQVKDASGNAQDRLAAIAYIWCEEVSWAHATTTSRSQLGEYALLLRHGFTR